ncbi:UDP-galactose transporter [Pestalotiopsis sp. NC0098]|nr:UDP-galactose transporter [Pestalotiopsis sp. NC0098]
MGASRYWRYWRAQPTAVVFIIMLICQNTTNILLQHRIQNRKDDGPIRYEPLSALVLSEALKLLVSFIGFSWFESDMESSADFMSSVQDGHTNAALPAVLYTLSTAGQAVGAYHLDVIPYLMLSQFKLILTPVFSRGLAKQTLRLHQWVSLMLMTIGMIFVQVNSTSSFALGVGKDKVDKNIYAGISAMLAAGCCNAFASVYMEVILKASEHGFIVRNAQLAFYSCLCAIGGFLWQSDFEVASFFRGYTILVWISVILQAMGGFLVSWVVCASNTMAKNYAQSLGFLAASIIPLISSPQLLTPRLYCGTTLVLVGVFGAI